MFTEFTGDLMVEDVDQELYESDDWGDMSDLYQDVVFKGSDSVGIRFTNTMAHFFRVLDSDVRDGVYYPDFNETVATVAFFPDGFTNYELFAESVSLEIARVRESSENEENLFIHTQSEIPAYSGFYFIENETLYRALDPLLMEPPEASPSDEFLGIVGGERMVRVENVQEGYVSVVDFDRLFELIEDESKFNGALKLSEDASGLLSAIDL